VEGHVRGVELETAANGRARTVYGDAVILATGGLFGGGLHSDVQGKITEMTHNLEVVNVPPLDEWFSEAFLSGQPQPIHYAGLLTDALLRPLTGAGEPAAPNLFAAGRLLAGYSPIVEGCTEGVDIATAAHAVMQALMMQPARAKS
jgi:glycerol-3-phosphate dehydrogenase subunit B